MSDLAIAIVTALGAGGLGAAYLSFLLARRRYSGRVATTDADAMWKRQEGQLAEARQFMLDQLHERDIAIKGLVETVAKQTTELREKDGRLAALQARVDFLVTELARKDHLIEEMEADGTRKDKRIAVLEQARDELSARVHELERIDAVRLAASRQVEAAHNPQGAGL